MAGVEAFIAPKPFKGKENDPETLLVEYDLYVKSVKNFLLATGKDTAADKQKVALLQAVGGVDMVELLEDTGKVIFEDVAADEDARIEAVVAETYKEALEKTRQGIVGKTKHSNDKAQTLPTNGAGLAEV